MVTNHICRKIAAKVKVKWNHTRLKNQKITIISQNCIGGVIYHSCGLEFFSPTINLFIEDENFVKFVENLEYYLSLQPVALTECYVDPIDSTIKYPKIKIGDIEICCLHSKSCADAIKDWERRRKKVYLDNVFVIGNSWNMHGNRELVERLCNNDIYPTVCFATREFQGITNCVVLQEDFWKVDSRGIIRPNITDKIPDSDRYYYELYFDFIAWFNNHSVKRKSK